MRTNADGKQGRTQSGTHVELATVGADDTGEQAQESAFAGAVPAENADGLALGDVEGQGLQGPKSQTVRF